MTAPTLYYSRAKLVGPGFLTLALGLTGLLIAYSLTGEEGFTKLHHAYVFYAFGSRGPRFAIVILSLLIALAGIFALRRVAGDREAATIRLDGLRIRTLLRSRMIPWRHLESITLSQRLFHEKVYRTMTIRSGRLPGESWLDYLLGRRLALAESQLDATPAEIASWARAAEAERRKALLYPRSSALQPVNPIRHRA